MELLSPPEIGTNDNTITVLHLSDLHFAVDLEADEKSRRRAANKGLIQQVQEVAAAHTLQTSKRRGRWYAEDNWSPDLIAISGDLAYRGKSDEFDLAAVFLHELRDAVGLRSDRVIVCPGNHDRWIEDPRGLTYPKNTDESDKWLQGVFNDESTLVKPFGPFISFCREQGFLRPSGIVGLDYLIGICRVPIREVEVEFLVTNSAWFAMGSEDQGKMRLGLRLLQALSEPQSSGEKAANAQAEPKLLRVGLCHHTREWLHPDDRESYNDRPNALRLLAERCDVLLHGHVHGALEPPGLAHNAAWTFTGGASYAKESYKQNFSFLQINLDSRLVRRRGFEYMRSVSNWEERPHAKQTIRLRSDGAPRSPDVGVKDLSGKWLSQYWQDDLYSVRQTYDDIELVRDAPGRFQTREPSGQSDAASPLRLRGDLSNDGYFSGRWWDVSGKFHGTFQLKVLSSGSEMLGRWIGFDGSSELRVGTWRFVRGKGNLESGRAILEPEGDG